MPATTLNIAAYRFVELTELPALREQLLATAQQLELRGTILLAPEGINLFLAGSHAAIHDFVAHLQKDARFSGIEVKYSESASQPFQRLRVRLKREIIRMDHPTIRPVLGRAPAVEARTLQRWLAQGHDDQQRPVIMVDTRNAFEINVGTFKNAVHYDIERFTQFPQAVLEHRAELEGKAVVTFCTGGIRCEKAAIFMEEAGIEGVYQLEGGILKYFEETDGSNFDGRCFVFDEREALDHRLQPLRGEVSATGSTPETPQ